MGLEGSLVQDRNVSSIVKAHVPCIESGSYTGAYLNVEICETAAPTISALGMAVISSTVVSYLQPL